MKKSVFSLALLCLIGFSCSPEDDVSEVTLREPASSTACTDPPSAITCVQVLGQWRCVWQNANPSLTGITYPMDGTTIHHCGADILSLTFAAHLTPSCSVEYLYRVEERELIGGVYVWSFLFEDDWTIGCTGTPPSQHFSNVGSISTPGTYRVQLYNNDSEALITTSVFDVTVEGP